MTCRVVKRGTRVGSTVISLPWEIDIRFRSRMEKTNWLGEVVASSLAAGETGRIRGGSGWKWTLRFNACNVVERESIIFIISILGIGKFQISSIFCRTIRKYSNLLKRFGHEKLEEKWKKERNGCKKIFFLFLPRERLSFLRRRKRSEELASLIILFLISSVSQIPKSNFEYILSNS